MLTDLKIRAAKPREKDFKLYDAQGLFLLVSRKGAKLWRYKYRFERKEKQLTLGQYPETTLLAARDELLQARKLLKSGIDPMAKRKADLVATSVSTAPQRSLEVVARAWWADRKESQRWDDAYAVQILRQLERDVFSIKLARESASADPSREALINRPVGDWPFDAITPPVVLELCKNVEARGSLDAARDLRSRIGMVYEREKALGHFSGLNPAESVVALLAKPKRTNHAAIIYEELPAFFQRLQAAVLYPTTRLGLEAIIATWLRSTELRLANWNWLDWEAREMRIPSSSMKNQDKGIGDHVVFLSDYALDVFRRLHGVTGHQDLMFPSLKHPREPISDGTWLNALYRMGYRNKATVHGIRALGSLH